ncbi:MAG: acyl-CoA dehydrogenase family protein [Dehalococcoidia bacterium]
MEFVDSETQRLLRSTARSYLADACPWERLFRIESGEEPLTEADVHELADLGWFGLLVPEPEGGGASLLDAAAVIEEVGYAGVPSPIAPANVAAWLLRNAHAPPEHLADLSSGTRLVTVAEATRGHAPDAAITAAGGKLTGALPLVPFADLSAFVLAPLLIDGEPAFAALPLANAELTPAHLIDRRCYAGVRWRDASLGDAVVLATGRDAGGLRERCEALVTAFSVIEAVGMMQRVLEMTTTHISTRQQFGQPVAKFQAARHRAAELLMQVESTRWAAYHALWRFEADPNERDEIWLTKHWAIRAADRVFQISHLLHGGVGVGMEHPLHLFTQGVSAFAVRGGTMNEMVARTLGSLHLTAPLEANA